MTPPSTKGDRRFIIVMIFSFLLGMLVALAAFVLWRLHAAAWQPLWTIATLVVCPPFILSYAIGAIQDSAFAIVLGVSTILLANGFLYAGVAAGIYTVFTLLAKRGGNN